MKSHLYVNFGQKTPLDTPPPKSNKREYHDNWAIPISIRLLGA